MSRTSLLLYPQEPQNGRKEQKDRKPQIAQRKQDRGQEIAVLENKENKVWCSGVGNFC